jgi:hypothetical protein
MMRMRAKVSDPMVTSSLHFTLAGAVLLASAIAGQAQQVIPQTGGRANSAPPTTGELSARAAQDAAQALDMAASPNGQPAPLLGPDGKLEKSGSNTAGLYDQQRPSRGNDKRSAFDPNSIHYPYGRASLGNIDPTSAANPYSPYGSLPNYSFPGAVAPLGPSAPTGVFRGGIPSAGRGR